MGMLAMKKQTDESTEVKEEDDPELTQILDVLRTMQSKQEDIKGQFKDMAESLTTVQKEVKDLKQKQ